VDLQLHTTTRDVRMALMDDLPVVLEVIKAAAEERLRGRVESMIENEMKEIVGELTKGFMEEFKPQVEAYIRMDASSMFGPSIDVNLRVSDKHNPNN